MSRIAFLLLLWLFLAGSGPARADEAEVRDARLEATDEGLVLHADFAFDLSPRLAEVVANGIPLYFVIEFEMSRKRWYWFDERAASRRLQLRLSYHAISRQYRISSGPLQQSVGSLPEALGVLKRLRNWLVLDRGTTLAEADYEAAVRLRLDPALLPKPFQLSAITSRDLQLETPWRRFTVRPPQHSPAPVETREQKVTEDR